MSSSKSKIVRRIQKLMALAEDQADRPEGERAAAAAQELMVKYAVEESDLEERSEVVERGVGTAGAIWREQLWGVVSAFLHCTACITNRSKRVFLVGKRQHLDAVEYLFETCERQILEACARWIVRQDGRLRRQCDGRHGLPESIPQVRDYLCSAVNGLEQQLRDLKSAALPKAQALMRLVDRDVEERLEELKVREAPEPPPFELHVSGYQAGLEVEVRRGVGSSQTPTEIGGGA